MDGETQKEDASVGLIKHRAGTKDPGEESLGRSVETWVRERREHRGIGEEERKGVKEGRERGGGLRIERTEG